MGIGAATILLSALIVVATACGNDGVSAPDVVEIVVPLGTQERLSAGETVELMPAELEFSVGDVLRIRNEDVADQSVGPYVVAAGAQFEMRFGTPGRYVGYCPLTEGGRYLIVITS